uniref:RRM domain-containing protein n=1 Tax=Ananas comosus var. bracteatus TaxID=296719 RepID=A0A6V7PAS1_ANACO|nr:unnamed protein product [Ananas comosus var. bracteatus]
MAIAATGLGLAFFLSFYPFLRSEDDATGGRYGSAPNGDGSAAPSAAAAAVGGGDGAAPPPPQQQYYQAPSAAGAPPPPMWNQQPSMVPPPVVPQQMGPPPPQQQYQASAAAAVAAPLQPGSADEIRTLWIGDLQYWMDETFLWGCFGHSGEVVSVKIIRNRQTGQSEGYGFIEFVSRATAERVLQTYNGQMMPNIEQAFRLNWASCGAGEKRGGDDGADHTIFVGDLASDVTDYLLQETFKARYSSVKGAKVITDRLTGISKGYGFVRFGDLNEQARAMTEMNGVYCSSRPMRVGPAANKKNSVSQTASYQTTQGTESENDPNNTTIFVGGLDSSVTDDHLKQVFSSYGELVYVKIPVGKRCGFVQFANRSCAEEALKMLNGSQLGDKTYGSRGVVHLQISSLNRILTSGMAAIMGMLKVMIHTAMPHLKILTCMLMLHIRDTEIISSSRSSNSSDGLRVRM